MLTSYPQLPSLHNWEIIFPSQTKPCFQIPLQQHKTISYSYCCSQNNSCPCVVWSLLHVDSPLPGICTQPFSASCIDHSSATAPPLPGLWLLCRSSFSGSLPEATSSSEPLAAPGLVVGVTGPLMVMEGCVNHARFMCSAEGRAGGSGWVCLLRVCIPASLPRAWHLPGDQYFEPKLINE